jgi:hypothetical protein
MSTLNWSGSSYIRIELRLVRNPEAICQNRGLKEGTGPSIAVGQNLERRQQPLAGIPAGRNSLFVFRDQSFRTERFLFGPRGFAEFEGETACNQGERQRGVCRSGIPSLLSRSNPFRNTSTPENLSSPEEPVPLLTDVQFFPRISQAVFAASTAGLLAAQRNAYSGASQVL